MPLSERRARRKSRSSPILRWCRLRHTRRTRRRPWQPFPMQKTGESSRLPPNLPAIYALVYSIRGRRYIARRSGSNVELLSQVGGQRQRRIEVAQQTARLQRFDNKAGADLVVAADPSEWPAEQEMETRAQHVEVSERLPHLTLGVSHRSGTAIRVKFGAQSHEVVLVVAITRDRAAPHAHRLGFDQRPIPSHDHGGVAPMREGRIGPLESALLRQADQAGEQAVPVGQDEIAGVELGCVSAWAESLDIRHFSRR